MKRKSTLLYVSLFVIILGVSFSFLNIFSINYANAGLYPSVVADSENALFPDKSHSTLEFYIKTTAWYAGLTPVIHYSVDEFQSDPYTRYFYIYVDDTLVLSKYINGDMSGTVSTELLKGTGLHTIKIEIYYGGYGNGCYKLNYLQLSKLFWNYDLDKYAVFFWYEFDPEDPTDSGCISENRIDDYWDICEDWGYTVISHKNTDNWEDDISNLDALEDDDSIIFIYINGHGYYDDYYDYSIVRVAHGVGIRSDDLADELSELESNRILVFVDSCLCGDFKDKLDIDGVSVMTSSDETHVSYFDYDVNVPYAEPRFSNQFFNKLGSRETYTSPTRYYYWNAYDSFTYASNIYYWYYGLRSFNSVHRFFGY